MSRARQDWEEETEYSIYGCITHCYNKINEYIFKLHRYDFRSKQMNTMVTKLRACKAGQFLKKSILLKRCNNIMRQRYSHLHVNSIQYKMELESLLKSKEENDRVGIPTPGLTRKWNNQYILMEFVIENEFELKRLYVFCFFYFVFVCVCCLYS